MNWTIPEPAVSRKALILSAGLFWVIGGVVLVIRAGLIFRGGVDLVWPAAIGVVLGSLKHRIVFSKVVAVNLQRIRELSPHKDKLCLFAFQSVESYLFVILMVGLAHGLRYVGLPPAVLATIYLAIGAGLLLSSVGYFKSTDC
ncbi:MAG: hypothetical protein OEV49_14190 [candidate division Zixibacteria bacterium]|nr:hypothetical protein [candidate division Zixibacteria bacterium]MDH3937495.1 hypothetical protein [candidate division Zixibacteria bacterium]MDH4035104.1 hypothetical protein [candidate division Zixibacteria bacterium]